MAITGVILLTVLVPAQAAEKRIALVIGNGAYLHADRLGNPVNDARSVRDMLKSPALGFEVVFGEDLDYGGLRRAIGQFAGLAGDADVAIMFFAGHGATFGDTPYVVPVDAKFESLAQVPYELIAVETLIGELRRAKGVRIAILDACRDNAAERRLKLARGEGTRGLAPMKNPDGLILAYATQYLSTAADGSGSGHSPFTEALLHNIATPGLDVKDVFFNVGRDVLAATGGRQRPEISVSVFEHYALVPPAAGTGGTAPPGAGAAVSEAAAVWKDIQNTASVAVLDDFLRHYGDVPVYGSLARTKREELARLAAPPPVMPPAGAVALTAEQERGLKPKDSFKECAACPEMVVVPAGAFTMGSPENEESRHDDEDPQHVVTIGKAFAVGKLHVTVDQFAVFARETRYAPQGCDWRNPGFKQERSHPVVCVGWKDAKAYAAWLAKKTGKPYRLLSEAEWEYAARGRTSPGAHPRFWFGDDQRDQCRYGNGYDVAGGPNGASCNDGYEFTSPAGKFLPNAFGLYDMAGNAQQWTEDCYHESYDGAPADGSAWTSGNCNQGHVVRGSDWGGRPWYLRAALRDHLWHNGGTFTTGFRLARTLNP
jgi:formylglycine-generating enzyme required for sulfatase activity